MFRALAAGLLLVTLSQGQTVSPEESLRQAMQLQQSGDLEGAVRGYREFLAAHPNEAAVHSNLGVLLARLGRYDEAVSEYKKAADLDPNNAGIYLNLGLAHYKAGRIPEAAAIFAHARELAPDNSQATLLLADCYLRLGENKKVIALLTPVERQNAGDLAIAYLMGVALIRDGQVQEGQTRVGKILGNGDSAEARFLLGTQMFASGDFPAAVKQFAGAVELNPNLPDLQASYGQALLNTGDPDAAASAFQKELETDPNHFEANFYLAQIFIARQRWADAEPLVQRALTARPDSLEARLQLADLQVGQDKPDQALATLKAAEKLWPQSAAIHEKLAQTHERLYQRAAADREKKLAASLQPASQKTAAGPTAGEVAPEFSATKMGTSEKQTLAALRNSGPVLLVFGSYTCPNFRGAAAILNQLYSEYKSQIPFYLIYIREAHSTADWMSTQNQREGIVLKPATNMAERQEHATMCVRKLHLDFPALMDGMNGAAEKAYSAWPSKAVLVDRHGRILFTTGLSEQDFNPQQFAAALRKVSGTVAQSRPLQRVQ